MRIRIGHIKTTIIYTVDALIITSTQKVLKLTLRNFYRKNPNFNALNTHNKILQSYKTSLYACNTEERFLNNYDAITSKLLKQILRKRFLATRSNKWIINCVNFATIRSFQINTKIVSE